MSLDAQTESDPDSPKTGLASHGATASPDPSLHQPTGRPGSLLHRTVPNMVARIMLIVMSTLIVTFGIALSRATMLGSSPISAVPTVLSFLFEPSVGTFTFYVNIIFVAIQAAILRKDFHPVQLLQVPYLILFSLVIDFWVGIVAGFPLDNYLLNLFWILLSCAFVAMGVWLQTQARLIMLPGDAIVVAISHVSHWKFPRVKLGFDVSQMIIAVAISLFFTGTLYGVREGTLIAALLVGPMIRLIGKFIPTLEPWVPTEGFASFLPKAN